MGCGVQELRPIFRKLLTKNIFWYPGIFLFFRDRASHWLVWISLCRPGWPRTPENPTASASRTVINHACLPGMFLEKGSSSCEPVLANRLRGGGSAFQNTEA